MAGISQTAAMATTVRRDIHPKVRPGITAPGRGQARLQRTPQFVQPIARGLERAAPALVTYLWVMSQYLVAIHHPDDYDPSREDEAMHRDIGALNLEMKTAGVRVFAGGLQHPPSRAKSLRARADGKVVITDGPYLEAKEHIGGFWVLEAANMDEALAWGRKAAVACRAPVEVREFY